MRSYAGLHKQFITFNDSLKMLCNPALGILTFNAD